MLAVSVLAACTAPGPQESPAARSAVTPSTVASTVAPSQGTPSPVRTTSAATSSPGGGLAAFEDALRCENEELGFRVEYPSEWWANERIDPEEALTPIPSCTYFAPHPVDLRPNAAVPAGVAIRFDVREGGVERWETAHDEILSREETSVDGRDGVVWEVAPTPSAGFIPEGSLVYEYIITLDGGARLVAATDNILQPDAAYEQSKAILDRMMGTITLDR